MSEPVLPITIIYPAPGPHTNDFFEALGARSTIDLEVVYCARRFDERAGWPESELRFRHEFPESRRISRRWEMGVWTRGLGARVRRGVEAGRIHLVGGGYTHPSIALAMMSLNARRAPWFMFSEKPGISASLPRRAARGVMLGLTARRATGILAHSPLAVDAYAGLGFPRDRLHFIPYAMHVDEMREIARPREGETVEGPLRFLYFGRLEPIKGADWMLEAFAALPEDGGWSLTIAGSGGLADALKARAGKIGAGRITLTGEVPWDERAALYFRHDVLVFPSRHDGWGMAAMEAMAAGMPVLGSAAAGAVAAFVREGVNGHIVAPEDVAGLTRVLLSCVARPGMVGEMGRAARESTARWTPAAVAGELEATLRRAITGGGAPRIS